MRALARHELVFAVVEIVVAALFVAALFYEPLSVQLTVWFGVNFLAVAVLADLLTVAVTELKAEKAYATIAVLVLKSMGLILLATRSLAMSALFVVQLLGARSSFLRIRNSVYWCLIFLFPVFTYPIILGFDATRYATVPAFNVFLATYIGFKAIMMSLCLLGVDIVDVGRLLHKSAWRLLPKRSLMVKVVLGFILLLYLFPFLYKIMSGHISVLVAQVWAFTLLTVILLIYVEHGVFHSSVQTKTS